MFYFAFVSLLQPKQSLIPLDSSRLSIDEEPTAAVSELRPPTGFSWPAACLWPATFCLMINPAESDTLNQLIKFTNITIYITEDRLYVTQEQRKKGG